MNNKRRNYIPFLRYWLLMCTTGVGFYFCQTFGLINYVWENDFTKISFLILFIFLITSLLNGVNSFRVSKLNKDNEESIVKKNSFSWFMSNVSTSLGLLGTVIGMLVALSGFNNVDISDVTQAKILISHMTLGISTALLTTLVGLVVSLLLKLQSYNLDYSLSRESNSVGD